MQLGNGISYYTSIWSNTTDNSIYWEIYNGLYFRNGSNSSIYTYFNASDGSIDSTSYKTHSDYRIKDNVSDLSGVSIDNLRPVSYINTITQKYDFGFIAHEIQEIFPHLVTGEKDCSGNLQTVNYTSIIPILVKEIKDLKSKNIDLEYRILLLEQNNL